ncbi:MAG: hypothetical protein E6X21_14255 [Clostridium sp.]|uniref:hypothetical protein n=1 Tax=Clostridium sp. TaxID=1506 RepID=UPI002906FF3C|nr:hypothetical protein [Clostridium sp.]
MSDSVGKISLDLEVQSDLSNQISSVSNSISNNLKKSLSSGMKGTFENMNSAVKNNLNSITSHVSSSMKKTISNIAKTMKSILSSMKMPKINIPRPNNVVKPRTVETNSNVNKRGPPADAEILKSQVSNMTANLDNIGSKIELQTDKLKRLKEEYNNCFNQKRKNVLEEEMAKTEGKIIKLIGQADKLSLKLFNLEDKMSKVGSGASKASGGTSKLKSVLNSMYGVFNKSGKGANELSHSTKIANGNMGRMRSGIGFTLNQMFKWMIILPMIAKGIRSLGTGLINNLKTNEQFSNSLAQIKSNLMIAFTPIYQAILPAINALMSALSVATQYIASFISAIFGKTFEQSKQATQGLIDAKNAMGVYGDSAKKAGKAAKDALGLASFDEINSLNANKSDDSSGGSGGASKVPQLVTPALDTTSVDSAMQKLTDKIKAYFGTFDFNPLVQSFNKIKEAVEPILNNIGKVIKWFLTEILDPLAHWTIEDALPAFLNVVAGALEVLNPILEVFMDAGKWLWDNILQPIAEWTGGIIVDVLNGLADVLSKIGAWINEHKETLSKIAKVIGIIGIALGAVKIAIAGVAIVMGILTSPITLIIGIIVGLIAIFTQLYDSCEGFRNFVDTVVEFGKNLIFGLFEGISSVMSTIGSWLKDNIVDPILNAIKSFFGIHSPSTVFAEIGTYLMQGLLNGIKSLKESIIDFFGNFCTNLKEIFTNIPKWFGEKFVEAKNAIIEKFSPIGRFFSNLFGSIKDIFTNIGGAVSDAVSGAFRKAINGVLRFAANTINGFIRAINGAIGLINKIPGVDIGRINYMDVPQLAKGGILDSPTLAMVGEAGKEAVVPLENNTGGLDLLASKLLERMPQGGSNDNSNGDLVLMIDGSVIGKVALNQLRKMQRQGGITLIPT